MKSIYFQGLIKHQYKGSKSWSGDIAFCHILIQKICLVLMEVFVYILIVYLGIKFQNIALLSK